MEISEKQRMAMEICRRTKMVLFSGPRYSTKTMCGLACVCDHAWRIDRANVTLVTVSQSQGVDSGVWEDLTTSILPQYMAMNPGMKWVRKPFIANPSKKPTCIVGNAHGTASKIQLDSLKNEKEVEARFKGKRYSMLYVPELSNFRFRKTFDIWGECLRMIHLPENQHLFLGDTNPSDEGEESWIYKVWYEMRVKSYTDFVMLARENGLPVLPERAFDAFKRQLELIEFDISDNIWASQDRIDELVARYSHDQDLYDRYILGKWVQATADALFAEVFRPGRHVIGQIETPGTDDPMILIPDAECRNLIVGWDPGSSANSAATIIEKWIPFDPKTKRYLQPIYKCLDEVVITQENHTIDEFTLRVAERMRWWEEYMGVKYSWTHWSDRSVFDMKEPKRNRYYHQLIAEASEGEIMLKAAERGPGTVQQKIDMMKRLLFENRIVFSNDLTPRAIKMCKSLKKGTTENQPIQKGSIHKHSFDSIMYPVSEESYEETGKKFFEMLSRRNNNGESTIVAVSY